MDAWGWLQVTEGLMGNKGGGGEVSTSPAPTVEDGTLQILTYLDENGQLVSIDMQH